MPFMTEEAWRYIPHEGEALIIADWPQADAGLIDDDVEARMAAYLEIVREIRNTRAEFKVDPGQRIRAIARAGAATEDLAKTSTFSGDFAMWRLWSVSHSRRRSRRTRPMSSSAIFPSSCR